MTKEMAPEQVALDEETLRGIKALAKLANKAEESGLLEIIQAFLDEGVLEKLVKYLVTPDTLRVLDRLETLLKVGSYLAISLEEEAEPKSLLAILNTVRKDPELRAGLVKLIKFIKLVGSIKPEE